MVRNLVTHPEGAYLDWRQNSSDECCTRILSRSQPIHQKKLVNQYTRNYGLLGVFNRGKFEEERDVG